MNYEERERERRAFKEGKSTARLGGTVDDCPKKYKVGGLTWCYWMDGFREGNKAKENK